MTVSGVAAAWPAANASPQPAGRPAPPHDRAAAPPAQRPAARGTADRPLPKLLFPDPLPDLPKIDLPPPKPDYPAALGILAGSGTRKLG